MSSPQAVGQFSVGHHVLLDLWGAQHLDDCAHIEAALRRAAQAAGATVLHCQLHRFPAGGQGVTGVLLLAESHISIHTWPEHAYAAVDVFMCGQCDPHASLPALHAAFEPQQWSVRTAERGALPPSPTQSMPNS